MDKEKIKEVVLDQATSNKENTNIISRELESSIEKNRASNQILIISGIRRCGKSTLLNKIRSQEKENDYYLNFDDERLINFTVDDFQALYEVFLELFDEQGIFYFDEIQNILGWERFIRRLQDSGNKIYITGSNASMLSRELGTHLTGRHIQEKLFPFSFAEYLKFNNAPEFDLKKINTKQRAKIKRFFNNYLKEGGLPEFLKNKSKEYLKSLYESIIYRDIIVRYKLPNEKAIKELVYYAATNTCKEISFNSLKNVIGVSSATTVKEYFEYLENSYLIFLLPRFNYSLKKQIYSNKKVYIIDNGLANTVGFKFSKDYGRLLENIVFLELKRRNLEIYYHQEKGECDFIVKEGANITQAIQVTKTMSEESCYKREINGLLNAMNVYDLKTGIILTEDEEGQEKIDGKIIQIVPTWKWFLT